MFMNSISLETQINELNKEDKINALQNGVKSCKFKFNSSRKYFERIA